MTKKLHFYADGGHGWLRVLLSDLPYSVLAKVSACSYSSPSGKYVYLEEDCDVGHALAYFKTMGIDVDVKYHYTDGRRRSPIRNYPSFRAPHELGFNPSFATG